jgi:hypothetical protein
MTEATRLLRTMDLDMNGIGLEHNMDFTSKNKIAISEIKQTIIKAYESDGCIVLHIEGGYIE